MRLKISLKRHVFFKGADDSCFWFNISFTEASWISYDFTRITLESVACKIHMYYEEWEEKIYSSLTDNMQLDPGKPSDSFRTDRKQGKLCSHWLWPDVTAPPCWHLWSYFNRGCVPDYVLSWTSCFWSIHWFLAGRDNISCIFAKMLNYSFKWITAGWTEY